MNKIFKLSSVFIFVALMLLALQPSVEAGRRCGTKFRQSSVSFNFNLGLLSLIPSCYEYERVERCYPVYCERRVIRDYYPRVRERVIVYPCEPGYCEEVIVCPPRYRERVIVRPSYCW